MVVDRLNARLADEIDERSWQDQELRSAPVFDPERFPLAPADGQPPVP